MVQEGGEDVTGWWFLCSAHAVQCRVIDGVLEIAHDNECQWVIQGQQLSSEGKDLCFEVCGVMRAGRNVLCCSLVVTLKCVDTHECGVVIIVALEDERVQAAVVDMSLANEPCMNCSLANVDVTVSRNIEGVSCFVGGIDECGRLPSAG